MLTVSTLCLVVDTVNQFTAPRLGSGGLIAPYVRGEGHAKAVPGIDGGDGQCEVAEFSFTETRLYLLEQLFSHQGIR